MEAYGTLDVIIVVNSSKHSLMPVSQSSTFVKHYLRQFDYRFYLKPHDPMLYVLKNGHPQSTVQQHTPFPICAVRARSWKSVDTQHILQPSLWIPFETILLDIVLIKKKKKEEELK
uniref:Uncharacterized protein n=1 Tax=Glossina austeni TaxID=7395 RepID=A0A1A9USU2_GLOAU